MTVKGESLLNSPATYQGEAYRIGQVEFLIRVAVKDLLGFVLQLGIGPRNL